MSMSVTEYLGQRCDILSPDIIPVNDVPPAPCPFMNNSCLKLREHNKPICSLRRRDGTVWIVCRHRLCATKRDVPLTAHQKNIIMQVANTVFSPDVTESDILIRREVPMRAPGGSYYHADFIMINDSTIMANGPKKVVLEMQGGGETSNTGNLTTHVGLWEQSTSPSNTMLSNGVQGVGAIVTNAWRRQQEQFLVKGRVAMLTGSGNGIVFCVGSMIYDSIYQKIHDAGLSDLRDHNWTLALIGFSEDRSHPPQAGPIPFVVDTGRMLFTDYQAFVRGLTDQASPSPESFRGEFEKLSGGVKIVT